jgi:hypothetical protein
VERGNSTHGARQDDALADELRGNLGPGGSNREEWAEPEPLGDDDLDAARPDPNQDETQRLQPDPELIDDREDQPT